MTRDDAITYAVAAADAVWTASAPQNANNAFSWHACLGRDVGPSLLAHFVAEHRDAPAEALYRFAVAAEIEARPFDAITPSLRVTMEVFRASLLVLLRLVEADEAAARAQKSPEPVVPLDPKGIGRPAFELARPFAARVPMAAPAPAPQPKPKARGSK